MFIKNWKETTKELISSANEKVFEKSFSVTTTSNPWKVIFSDVLTGLDREFSIDNIDQEEWMKINFASSKYYPIQLHYSKEMLDFCFP